MLKAKIKVNFMFLLKLSDQVPSLYLPRSRQCSLPATFCSEVHLCQIIFHYPIPDVLILPCANIVHTIAAGWFCRQSTLQHRRVQQLYCQYKHGLGGHIVLVLLEFYFRKGRHCAVAGIDCFLSSNHYTEVIFCFNLK